MTKVNNEAKEAIKLIDIVDKIADVKQMCTIAERYLFGFIHSWDMGIVSTDMISEELSIVSDVVVNLNLVIEDVKKGLIDYRKVSNG